jgi:ATP phosphoribosyltransferase regulatory subunit HisZ
LAAAAAAGPLSLAIDVDEEGDIAFARQHARALGPFRRHAEPIGRDQQDRALAGFALVIDQLAGEILAADGIADGLDAHRQAPAYFASRKAASAVLN